MMWGHLSDPVECPRSWYQHLGAQFGSGLKCRWLRQRGHLSRLSHLGSPRRWSVLRQTPHCLMGTCWSNFLDLAKSTPRLVVVFSSLNLVASSLVENVSLRVLGGVFSSFCIKWKSDIVIFLVEILALISWTNCIFLLSKVSVPSSVVWQKK